MGNNWKWVITMAGTKLSVDRSLALIKTDFNLDNNKTYDLFNYYTMTDSNITEMGFEFIDDVSEESIDQFMKEIAEKYNLDEYTIRGYYEDREPDVIIEYERKKVEYERKKNEMS